MSETPVPETLETIAAKIDALRKSNDERFGKIDRQFGTIDHQFGTIDRRFDELKSQLGVQIEAVDTKVQQVYDEVIAMRAETKRNAKEHKAFTRRLDSHDLRILAIEKPGPAKP